METFNKKMFGSLLLIAFLTISFATIPEGSSADNTAQERALSIIEDVVGLDLSKGNVELSSYHLDRPDEYGGRVRERCIYTITCGESKVDFALTFLNNTFWYCDIYSYNSSLSSAHYSKQMPTNTLDATREILQRLQTNQADSYIQPMLDSMNTVKDLDSANATISNNTKRQVFTYTDEVRKTVTSTKIEFMYSVNGADSPKVVSISFENGALRSLTDGWKFFKVGEDSLKMSREEAINIAKEQANKEAKTTLKIADQPIRADLHLATREPFVLYPYWFIELPLNYSGSTVTGWQVGIWADTGEIGINHPTGILGSPPGSADSATTPPVTPTETLPDMQTQTENYENPQLLPYVAAAIASIMVAIVLVMAIAVRKNRAK
jgi:hypothetical protein